MVHLSFRGEPGIGKTVLLEQALVESEGMRQLRTAGVDAEYELPFSALSQLLGPVLDLSPLVPDFPRAALEGALGLGPPVEQSDFASSVATLILLSEAAAQSGGLLCVVDDAHRIDAASAKVLTFVARRIGADNFSILFAARTGEPTSFDASGIATIDLAPLGTADALVVLLAAARDEIAAEVAATLVSLSGGNPLALRELPTLLDVDQMSGRSPLPEPLPAGRGVLDAFLARIKGLNRTTRLALLVVAASHDGDSAMITRALQELAVPADALEAAEDADLIERRGAQVRFRHPLIRSTVYEAAPPTEQRSVHRALGASAKGEHTEARAWHRAQASVPPDDEVAEDLERSAATASLRGAPVAAANALARASRFHSEPERTARTLVAAAEAWWTAGRPDAAEALLDEIAEPLEPELALDMNHLRGRIALWTGRPLDCIHRLNEVALAASKIDMDRASLIQAEAAAATIMSGDAPASLISARKAVRFAQSRTDFVGVFACSMLAEALVLNGFGGAARSMLRRVVSSLDNIDPLMSFLFAQAAYTAQWVEDFEAARGLLERVIGQARRRGSIAQLPFALAVEAQLDLHHGYFDAARASAGESLELAVDSGQLSEVVFSTLVLARAEAISGDIEHARRLLEEVGARAREHGISSLDSHSAV